MEEEEEMKRAGELSGGGVVESPALRRKKETGTTAEFEDELTAWLSMEESETESVSELLKLLDDDSTEAAKVRFSDNPYSSALVFQSSSSYITINGNEESCGSSFSDSESSVMASVDMGGMLSRNVKVENGLEGIREWLEAEEGSAWGRNEEEARGWMVNWEWEWDEEQLARLGNLEKIGNRVLKRDEDEDAYILDAVALFRKWRVLWGKRK
ncbi:hypothetical protein COLO4_18199 [Corchorus olitorius]|uniref:Uncharacterized protein n=1 Tax=Corchorus olitorius TaxID=93759 RepID=A0A1R3JA05_9ROSI|nr:hypothetical protein COLO4_18199 [Corchorus olitorius]